MATFAADEFKIFTNVHSAVVDPKHFNPKSFIDYSGDVCIIPLNSFVLARTVEYFLAFHATYSLFASARVRMHAVV